MLYMEISNQVMQNCTKSAYQVQAHGFRSFHQDIIMVAGAVLVGYSLCDSAWVCIFLAIKQLSRTSFSWRLVRDSVTRWSSEAQE
ncbi:hypothetical protein MRB53_015624 [Persea americana]|uniref:Uncharacterized protein n=1 Tax=Persea americana TaxID=3435 RepID=A0ACC2LZT9_PERAE|nr:hypothetical protein MRB53_015624 [Persea americana]